MKKQTNRKITAAWKLTWLFTALFALPHCVNIVCWFVDCPGDFAILSETTYASFIGAIWFFYFGANVTEKHKSFTQSNNDDEIVCEPGSGGQPCEPIGSEK